VIVSLREGRSEINLAATCNGILAGLVCVTAGCGLVEAWAGFVIGILGGITYTASSFLVAKLGIDDPLDAFSVHGASGLVGTLLVGFFHNSQGIFYGGGIKLAYQVRTAGCHFRPFCLPS
jgi:Amt family ammonium transporter